MMTTTATTTTTAVAEVATSCISHEQQRSHVLHMQQRLMAAAASAARLPGAQTSLRDLRARLVPACQDQRWQLVTELASFAVNLMLTLLVIYLLYLYVSRAGPESAQALRAVSVVSLLMLVLTAFKYREVGWLAARLVGRFLEIRDKVYILVTLLVALLTSQLQLIGVQQQLRPGAPPRLLWIALLTALLMLLVVRLLSQTSYVVPAEQGELRSSAFVAMAYLNKTLDNRTLGALDDALHGRSGTGGATGGTTGGGESRDRDPGPAVE